MPSDADTIRHERQWPMVNVTPNEWAARNRQRTETGQFTALPLLQRVEWNPMKALCTCGIRRGRHRWGDEACPNPWWRIGNGHQPWLSTTRYERAAVQV